MAGLAAAYDRLTELRAFDETKSGVKGLVDAGVTEIPRFFIQPTPIQPSADQPRVFIPTIDLAGINNEGRSRVVEQVKIASQTLGFFQVVNHGVPEGVAEEMLEGVRAFHGATVEEKKVYYTRERGKRVTYTSNFDLYTAPAANWRDSVFAVMAPEPPTTDEVPPPLRKTLFEYSKHVERLGNTLLELLSEALGLESNHLKEMDCGRGHAIVMNYYPPCPEPHLTLGASKHSDPDFLTILLQDEIGGLQVFYQNEWIDVAPLPGAFVVNIGDLLQLISNDKFKSIEHRVLANTIGPRVSVACFFTMHLHPLARLYGPIKELISYECPPVYREIQLPEYISHYEAKGLDGRSALDKFKL